MQEVKKENYLQTEKMETKYKINKAINKQVCVILFSEPVTSLTYVIFILLGYKPIECSIHSQCSDDQGKRHSEPVAMSSIYVICWPGHYDIIFEKLVSPQNSIWQ